MLLNVIKQLVCLMAKRAVCGEVERKEIKLVKHTGACMFFCLPQSTDKSGPALSSSLLSFRENGAVSVVHEVMTKLN